MFSPQRKMRTLRKPGPEVRNIYYKGDVFSPRRHHASGVTGFGKGENLSLGECTVSIKAINSVSRRDAGFAEKT
jgi:hypothetical protein